jgi:hypothetical protein
MENMSTLWHPLIGDLKLPNVPTENQADVRNILRPALGNIPVEPGECWRTAQQLTLAGGPEIRYVEGAYVRHPRNQYLRIESINEHIADPHAWNIVSGYIVDLTVELFAYKHPSDNLWVYEPLREYLFDEVKQYQADFKKDLTETDIEGNVRNVYHSMTYVMADKEFEAIFSDVTKTLQERRALIMNSRLKK